jgi:hypothetical protein
VRRDTVLPILYKGLTLFCGSQLDCFLVCHSHWAVGSLIRSLTLYLSVCDGLYQEDI